jgi:hypothetical protein
VSDASIATKASAYVKATRLVRRRAASSFGASGGREGFVEATVNPREVDQAERERNQRGHGERIETETRERRIHFE